MKLLYVRQGDTVQIEDKILTTEKSSLISIDSSAKQFDSSSNEITMYITIEDDNS